MKARSFLAIGATAVTIVMSGFAFAQAPGSPPGTGADHHPNDPKAPEQPSASGAQAQGSPVGPGMMGQPDMMGPGMMQQPGMMGPGQMGYGMMGPGMMMGGRGMVGSGMMTPGMMGPGMMMGGSGMMNPGMMNPGMMMGGRGMMGPGMMGRGMMMGHHGHHGPMMGLWGHGRRIYLSADDIKRIVDGQLAWQGLKRLKVGAVKVVNNDTVAADIVTKEGSLAVRFHVDRHSGRAVIAD